MKPTDVLSYTYLGTGCLRIIHKKLDKRSAAAGHTASHQVTCRGMATISAISRGKK